MKAGFILGLIVAFGLLSVVKAQVLSTKIVRIEIDGKEVRKQYKVFVLSHGKWIQAATTPTGFVVPSELTADEYLTILFTFGKHSLKFSDIQISNFKEDWVVGIDNKPFSEEFVKPEDAEKTKFVYYVQFVSSEPNRQLVIAVKAPD